MSLLRETVNDYVVNRLEDALSKIEKRCESIIFTYDRMLKEGVTDDLPLDIDGSITELEKRLKAAWRGITILKKFPKNSESLVLHRRRIFDNMGKIKKLMVTLMKTMGNHVSQDESETDGLNSDQQMQSQGQPQQQARPQAQPPQQFNQRQSRGFRESVDNLDVARNNLNKARQALDNATHIRNPQEFGRIQNAYFRACDMFERAGGFLDEDGNEVDEANAYHDEQSRQADIYHDQQDRAFR